MMKRNPSKKDAIAVTVSKILATIQELKTEEELREFLRMDSLRPRSQHIAEGRRLLEEAKQELCKTTYMY
jgi:hypothetical protein